MKREPEVIVGICAGCKRLDDQVLKRVSMSRYRCLDCIAQEAANPCTPKGGS